MSYKNKKISRLLQKHMQNIKEQIYFKTSHISQGWKFALLWIFLCFISLFLPWISPLDTIISCGYSDTPISSSFSWLLGGIWFFILLSLSLMSFSLFSIKKKERLHFFSLIELSDISACFLWSIFIFILSLHSFFLVIGLQFFSVNILYGKGIILCITWSIIIFIASLLLKQEYRKNIKWSYISELKNTWQKLKLEEKKDNMKFPF